MPLPALASETSRALPNAWIDRLFERFALMYGKHWFDQWGGLAIDDVKAAWATDLAFASGEQVRKALDHCRTHNKFPPTSPEFVGLCKAFSATYDRPALPDYSKGEIAPAVRAEIAKFLTAAEKRDPKDWARRILAEQAAGNYPHVCGIEMAKRALGLAA
jgi:hypothetical protein